MASKTLHIHNIKGLNKDGETVREYEIWSEGYRMNSDHQPATFHGKALGKSFNEACINYFKLKDAKFGDGMAIDPSLFNAERLTYWGCRLFPTEEEARRSFG